MLQKNKNFDKIDILNEFKPKESKNINEDVKDIYDFKPNTYR